jgi:hypothetical protein
MAPVWVGIVVCLVVAYAVFLGIARFSGMGADDRLIGRAVWSKVKGVLPTAGVGEG